MGAGISLGEDHISEIIKRDLTDKHEDKMKKLPPCLPEYETWRKFIEDGHHQYQMSEVDKYAELAKQIKVPKRN